MTRLSYTGLPVRDGWRELRPGIYDDGQGGVQIDAAEVCASFGVPLTDRNLVTIIEEARDAIADLFGADGPPLTIDYHHGSTA